jgi:hypothetical protein
MIGPTGTHPGTARVHGVHLVDPGTCQLGDHGTLTLKEWWQQQQETAQ